MTDIYKYRVSPDGKTVAVNSGGSDAPWADDYWRASDGSCLRAEQVTDWTRLVPAADHRIECLCGHPAHGKPCMALTSDATRVCGCLAGNMT